MKDKKHLYALTLTIVCFLLLNTSFANDKVKVKLDYYQAKIETGNETFDKLLPFYDTVIGIYKNKKDIKEQVRYMIKKAEFANRNGQKTKSFHIYKDVLAELKLSNDLTLKEETKKCIYNIALNAMDLGMFEEGAVNTFELLKYLNGTDLNYEARGYSILGFIFLNLGKSEESEEYNNKALEIVRTVDTISRIASVSVYSNYARLLFINKEYDSTIKYLTEAKRLAKDIKDVTFYSGVSHNFALFYEEMGEYKIAEEYFLNTLKLIDYNEHLYLTALTYQNLAQLCNKMNKTDRSLEYYNKAISIATKIGASQIRGESLIAISDLYYEKLDYKKSRDLLNQGRKVIDSVFNTNNVDRISILTNNFETQNEAIERQLTEQTIALSNLKKNVLFGIIFVIIVVVIIISLKLIKQNNVNKKLSNTISALTQKNIQYEERSQYKFESIIDVKNKELTTTTLSLVTANEILFDIKEQFKKLKVTTKDAERQVIFKVIENLFKSYNPEHGKEEFRLYFEQVQQSFFTKLNEKHPDLSYDDQRICALLILNLSAKEIAMITNKSIRTVEAYIYNIRKSLDIPTKVKTIIYLRQFVD